MQNGKICEAKKMIYETEDRYLSPYAVKSKDTKGRLYPIPPCPLRTEFSRDRDRIIHSKAFRRLKHKTQVFIAPEGDHYRTRLTHTLEVSQIARTIARGLRMNEDLTEAIGLGHDLGHTPFGHAGERTIAALMKDHGGFTHSAQSLRVVDFLENDGKGMNLTFEVRDGIRNHTRAGNPQTLEGKIVRISDQIAYLNHDLDDAMRGGEIKYNEIPDTVLKVIGSSHGERIDALISDVIENSFGINDIVQSTGMRDAMNIFREFMFDNLYMTEKARKEEEKVVEIITTLFGYYMERQELLPAYILGMDSSPEQKAADYVSMMSDSYALRLFDGLSEK